MCHLLSGQSLSFIKNLGFWFSLIHQSPSSVTLFGDFSIDIDGLSSSLTSSPPLNFSSTSPQQPSALLSVNLLHRDTSCPVNSFSLFSNSLRAPVHYCFCTKVELFLTYTSLIFSTFPYYNNCFATPLNTPFPLLSL